MPPIRTLAMWGTGAVLSFSLAIVLALHLRTNLDSMPRVVPLASSTTGTHTPPAPSVPTHHAWAPSPMPADRRTFRLKQQCHHRASQAGLATRPGIPYQRCRGHEISASPTAVEQSAPR